VQTLVNFLEALMISCIVVYAIYGLAVLAMFSVWWTVRFASWAIVFAAFGVTLLVTPPIWWMIHRVARFRRGVNNIQSSRAVSTAISYGAAGDKAKSRPAPRVRPSFPDVAISVTEASEALYAYERRVFGARSEIRETVSQTLEAIAQARSLMAQVDATAAEGNRRYAVSAPN